MYTGMWLLLKVIQGGSCKIISRHMQEHVKNVNSQHHGFVLTSLEVRLSLGDAF